MVGVQELPGPEPPYVAVADVCTRVEHEGGAPIGVVRQPAARRVAQRAGHPKMDDERPTALEPPEEVLPSSLDGSDPLSDERFGDEKRVHRPRQACVDDLGARDRRADEHRR